MNVSPDILIAVSAVVGSGGAAWAGVRASLNGTRQRVTRIEGRQDAMDDKLDRIAESTARLEVEAMNARNILANRDQ